MAKLPKVQPDELLDDTIPDVDKLKTKPRPRKKEGPLWRVYEGSRLPVSKSLGVVWRSRYEAAKKTYEALHLIWDECYKYYNASNVNPAGETTRGTFVRGDGTENIVFSTVNVLLPAVYGKDPDFTCNTVDDQDEAFCKVVQQVISAVFRRRDMLNGKMKVKRAVGFAFLTNSGVVKLDFNAKEDSRELVLEALEELSKELEQAKSPQEVRRVYGKIEALEARAEIAKPSGFEMKVVLPHQHILDPYAEQVDGLDSNWQIEDVFLPTYYLQEMYTKPSDESGESQDRVFVFKPTHKLSTDAMAGRGDDTAQSMVFQALSSTETANDPTKYTEEERLAYMHTYYTQCVYVWDKVTKRVMLFLRDDWTWPLWVWDDPYKLSRFFPYFIFSFGFSTGRTTGIGEVAQILDHQDNINDINRQVARIRRTVYDYFLYNSNKVDPTDAEAMIGVLRGESQGGGKHALGVKLEEGQKISDVFEALLPPSADYEKLFDKTGEYDIINRMTNLNEALRGGQFRTNTNVPAVETYQEATRIALSAKVDPIEDTLSDLGEAIAEIAVQNFDNQDVEKLVGAALAKDWKQMDIQSFKATYSLEVVAGSTEKPNSAFKKKEAIQIAQAIGQFAKAAPGAVVKIMLRMFQKAFTSITMQQADWDLIDQEIAASMKKGDSTGQGGQPAAAAQAAGAPPQAAAQVDQLLAVIPDEIKQQIAQMVQAGARPEEILAALQQAAARTAPNPQQAQGAQPQPNGRGY